MRNRRGKSFSVVRHRQFRDITIRTKLVWNRAAIIRGEPRVSRSPPGTIPVFIVNFNRLETTRKLVEYLDRIPRARPLIIDCGSTYPPLREWYRTSGRQHHLVGKNIGHRAPWITGLVGAVREEFYAITDSDLDISSVPIDLFDVLADGFKRHPKRRKSGLSLEISDLPADSPFYNTVTAEQTGFWANRLDERFFDAPVDTTFALYRSRADVRDGWMVDNSLRSDRPYTARHVPWYLTRENMTEEDLFFLRHASRKTSNFARWAVAAGLVR